ncbi:MAG: NAD(P)-binding domain-containing protein [Vicinamibacterales bacterium]
MTRVSTVVIGAGQAGLAMSHCLAARGIGHVVLERGRIGERWRSERWDSLRLLTPNWQSRLPGFCYDGPDPDGYMSMPDVVAYLERYAASFGSPVKSGVAVESVARVGEHLVVRTTGGDWSAQSVVIATGHSDTPRVPALAGRVPAGIAQLVPTRYRRADRLADGGVLVVGASSSGLQLAEEIHRSGRPVTIAVGAHTRLPRDYRGRDILWWLDRMGVFDETTDDVYDIAVSRSQPSLQLIGHPDHVTLDLATLHRTGVRVVGRLLDVEGDTAVFDDDLVATTAAADIKLATLLRRVDRFAEAAGIPCQPAPPFQPHCLGFADAETRLDLAAAGVKTVVWATGFRRHYPWLHLPVLDGCGDIRHERGLTDDPGLFVIGLHFLRRRKSAFLDGVGTDARELTDHVASHLARVGAAVA